jgi:hypothetical protein
VARKYKPPGHKDTNTKEELSVLSKIFSSKYKNNCRISFPVLLAIQITGFVNHMIIFE